MKHEMNLHERAEMVRAMETVVRNINDEEIFWPWLEVGVADGDIDGNETDEDLEYYCEDENFADLMGLFVRIMRRSYKKDENGALFCDWVCSKENPNLKKGGE